MKHKEIERLGGLIFIWYCVTILTMNYVVFMKVVHMRTQCKRNITWNRTKEVPRAER